MFLTVFVIFARFSGVFGSFLVFWVAWEKYRPHRNNQLAPSPPSILKAPCDFLSLTGKNPFFCFSCQESG